jgi:hypothetical protein
MGYSYYNAGQELDLSDRLMSGGLGTLSFVSVAAPLEMSIKAFAESSELAVARTLPEIPTGGYEPVEIRSTGLPQSLGPDVIFTGEELPIFETQVFSLTDTTDGIPLLLDAGKIADHHIFPRQFEGFFISRGINIDEFTVTLGQSSHLRGVHGNGLGNMPGKWNSRWAEFIENNPNASQAEVYKFAGSLMDEFNINHVPIHSYKQ